MRLFYEELVNIGLTKTIQNKPPLLWDNVDDYNDYYIHQP